MNEQPDTRPLSYEEAAPLADAWLEQHVSAVEVERRLCERGAPPDTAAAVVEEVLKRRLLERACPQERSDRAHLRRAVIWSIFGVVLFIVGVALAVSESGFAHPWFWAAGIVAVGLGVYHFVQARN